MDYIIAYDFGTSGVKGALVDRNGRIIAVKEKSYPLYRPKPLWVEQSPEDYWHAVCEVTKAILDISGVAPHDVKGLNFSVQAVTLIPIDESGNVLYNAISWLDGRAEKQANEINEIAGSIVVRSQDYPSRILWIKEEMPELYEKTKYFLECDGFLQYKCTGIMAVPSDYDGILWEHPAYAEVKKLFSGIIDMDKLPPMVEACREFGKLDVKGARELGLAEGTPVFGGMIDVPAAAVGCNCIKPGDAHVYFGSSGWVSFVIDRIYDGSEGSYQLNSIIPGLMIYGGCTNNACTMQDWVIDRFYAHEKEVLGDKLFDYLAEEMLSVPDGCDNLFAAPWLDGEQFPFADPHLRAMFFNISDTHSRAHFLKATLESLCFSMQGQIDTYRQDTGLDIRRLGANGGGSLSPIWMQMLSDITGVPVDVPESSRHSGAFGAAIATAIGLGWCDIDSVKDYVRISKTYHPSMSKHDMYMKKYSSWIKLKDTVTQLYDDLNS